MDTTSGQGSRSSDITEDRISRELATLLHELGPGAKLPPERDLAVQLGASRTALRDRLQLLEGLGVLTRRQGAGTFVQSLDPKGLALALDLALASSSLSVEALHSVRVALERQAAREAAVTQDPVAIGRLRKAVNDMVAATSSQDIDVADMAFHEALMRATGNPALTFFAEAMTGVLRRAVLRRRAELKRHPADKSVSIDAHMPLYEAVYAGDPDAAAAASDAHFAAWHDVLEIPSREQK